MNKPSSKRKSKGRPLARQPKGPGILTLLIVSLFRIGRAVKQESERSARAMRRGQPAGRRTSTGRGQQPRRQPAGRGQRSAGGGGATPGREHPRSAADRRSEDVWGDKGRDPWGDDDRGRENEPAWKRHGTPDPDTWRPEDGPQNDDEEQDLSDLDREWDDDPARERTAEQDAFNGLGLDDEGDDASSAESGAV